MLTNTQCHNASILKGIKKLTDGKGLYLWVYPNGRKYWRLRYWQFGKEKSLSLGVYPDISLKEARTKCDAERKRLDQGLDPSAERKLNKLKAQQSAENNFEAIAREWHEHLKHKWTPQYTTSTMRRLEANIFPKMGSRPITDITPAELLAVLKIIEKREAHDLAHRVHQVCGQIFTYAIVTGRIRLGQPKLQLSIHILLIRCVTQKYTMSGVTAAHCVASINHFLRSMVKPMRQSHRINSLVNFIGSCAIRWLWTEMAKES